LAIIQPTAFADSRLAAKLNVYQLGERLGVDPRELLDMINTKKIPTKTVVRGLAKELEVDERYLEKLASQIGMK
jgi:transcriptional regulator with XRE-family HTH domain